MVLGAPWNYAYLQKQQKEQSSLRFLYQYPETHQIVSRYQPNGPWCPLVQLLSITPKKEQYSMRFIYQLSTNHQNISGINQIGLGTPWYKTYL